ncbi:MAG TPA: ABC transporter permease, partial [Terriglobales bacterium]|nr:ABC transporter permease [Terriglobales bacterium]
IVAVITLALGIGANTAVFSVINSVLLRHLPFRAPGQLVLVRQPGRNGGGYTFSIGDYEDYRDRQKTFAALSLWVGQSVNLTGADRPDRIIGSFVSANFFPMMEVHPLLGRTFAPKEDQPGAERVAVLDYGTWQTRFGGNLGILGSQLTLNGEPYTVIGVLPPSFFFPWGHIDVWMTIQHYPNYSLDRATAAQLIMGRVRDGVSLEQATADLERIAAQLTRTYPREHPGIHIELTRMRDLESAPLRSSLLILAAAVATVLLIACANLGSLLLARSAARAPEIAIRRALGAGPMRILRQLLTEFLLIAAVAGTISILVARWSLALLLKLHPLPPELTPSLDSRVLGFAFLVALVVGVALGIVPALPLSRKQGRDLALSSERSSAGTACASRLRAAMIVVQTALAIVLLAAAALLVRSFRQLALLNPGFRSDHLLSFEYRLPKTHYGTAEQQWAFHHEMLQRIRNVPGVVSAAIVQGLPFSGNGSDAQFALPGITDAIHPPVAQTNVVTPGYFKTMGVT